MLRERTLPARTASARLVGAIREELDALAWPLRTLDAVSVVNGPGSFTGVRVGLAAAKGLCEVAGLRLVTLSRLEVLLGAANAEGRRLAVLDAGRGEFYVRSSDRSEEVLLSPEQLLALAGDGSDARVLIAEEKLLAVLEPLHPQWITLSAAHALTLTTRRLDLPREDVATADANYVRHARALYPNSPAASERR